MKKALVDDLMETAIADNELLIENQKCGDVQTKARDLEFRFYTKDRKTADLAASFVTDYRYGRATVQKVAAPDEEPMWLLSVIICAPATENAVSTLSVFMVCLSRLYYLDYDGWESTIQK